MNVLLSKERNVVSCALKFCPEFEFPIMIPYVQTLISCSLPKKFGSLTSSMEDDSKHVYSHEEMLEEDK